MTGIQLSFQWMMVWVLLTLPSVLVLGSNPLYQLGSSAASQAKKLHEAEVEEAIEVLVEEELGMNPTFGEGLPTMLPCDHGEGMDSS